MSDDPTKNSLKRRLNEAEPAERKAMVEQLPYEVGFGKPPKHTRYQPGHCGNKKGRPKGSMNFGLVLDRELNQTVEFTERGRRRRMSKLEVALRQLVNKAVSGDLPALNAVQQLLGKTGRLGDADAGRTTTSAIDQRDLEALSGMLEFFKKGASEPEDDGVGRAGT